MTSSRVLVFWWGHLLSFHHAWNSSELNWHCVFYLINSIVLCCSLASDSVVSGLVRDKGSIPLTRQRAASFETRAAFAALQQAASCETRPAFAAPQQEASSETRAAFASPQKAASWETRAAFVSPQQAASCETGAPFTALGSELLVRDRSSIRRTRQRAARARPEQHSPHSAFLLQ